MTTKNKRNYLGENFSITFLIVGFLCLAFTIYIGFRISETERKLFSISLVALYLGVLLESLRISKNWKIVLFKFIGAYTLSFVSFFPMKTERNYNFEDHIEMWPYFFLFFFLLISAALYKDKITAKLTEGITLLLTISFIYWLFDLNLLNFNNWYNIPIVILTFIFSLFSLVNALSYIKLTRTNRLWLSIWSTIIIFIIAIDNVVAVYRNGDIETNKLFSDNLFIGLQYFLVGISSVYIMQNLILLFGFIPSKNGKNYKNDLKETIEEHIERYSEKQTNILGSIFCILFTVGIFYINYSQDLLPSNIMIWLVIIFFSFVVSLINKLQKKTKN